MLLRNTYSLIIDLEATCSDDNSLPRNEMEIIEIGGVMMNNESFEIVTEFQTLVRPVRHATLTPFCTSLTGIKQADVECAPSFREAIDGLNAWKAGFEDSLFCSWGDFDRRQFVQDCEFHQVEYPFPNGHLNLKPSLAKKMGFHSTMGISTALKKLGLEFEGSPHRGLDDARNIAKIVRTVFRKSTSDEMDSPLNRNKNITIGHTE